jgi:DNA-binding transcriptional MerR regulator
LAEYRLEELARISGVSARNIRAYRERGLLDPPRRVGRSAFYDDYQLSQLRTISQLLRRGFNSAHIAEFFASMRQGADLADILGIQRALLGPREDQDSDVSDSGGRRPPDREPATGPRAIDIDPSSDVAGKLIDYNLAQMREGRVAILDPTIAEILGRAADQLLYVRALLRIYDSARDAVDGVAGGFIEVLEESVEARFGKNHVPAAGEIDELVQIAHDYRDLYGRVLSDRLNESLQRQLSTAVSGFTNQERSC